MFGTGTGTGPVLAACPVGQHLDLDAVSSCLANSTPLPPGTVELAIDADCPVEGDLEHPDPNNEEVFTFTEPAQMKTLLECILPEAVAWITWEYGSLDVPTEWAGSQATSLLPNHFLYVPTGVRVTDYMDTCQGEDEQGEYSYGDHDLAYCPIDGDIYIGEAQLWEDYHNHGDADVWGTISHEMGHRIQHVAGLPTSRTDNEQIPYENQADCFSGAFLDYSARQTPLTAPSTGDDLIDLFVGLFNIGDPRIGEDSQDHGSIDQRIRAFFVGYNSLDAQGAWACDFYVPGIIPRRARISPPPRRRCRRRDPGAQPHPSARRPSGRVRALGSGRRIPRPRRCELERHAQAVGVGGVLGERRTRREPRFRYSERAGAYASIVPVSRLTRV